MPTSKIHEALSIMKELRPIMDKPHIQTNGSHLLDVKQGLYQRIMQFAPGESVEQAMKNIMQVARPKLSQIRTDVIKPKGPVPPKVQAVLDALEDELGQWLRHTKLELQRNDCSRLHKLMEAMQQNRVYSLGSVNHDELNQESTIDVLVVNRSWGDIQTFIVTHNWAAAFKGAKDFDHLADFKLPYDNCCFELRIGGRTVIYVCRTDEDDNILVQPFVECDHVWVASKEILSTAKISPDGFLTFGINQVRAICVALEAEVAKHDVVRAPVKLNKARLSARKPPLNDYHVVSLARRSTVANPRESSNTGAHRRLHFRRGHWRHYPEFKTWVRWCLAGDPDLGFIDKDYTL